MAKAKRYRVTGMYVTAPTMTELGQMYVSLMSGATVPPDVPDWWVQHHLDNSLIEEIEEPAPPKEEAKTEPAPEPAPVEGEGKAEKPPGGPSRSTRPGGATSRGG